MSSMTTVAACERFSVRNTSKSPGARRTGVPGPCRSTALSSVCFMSRGNGAPGRAGVARPLWPPLGVGAGFGAGEPLHVLGADLLEVLDSADAAQRLLEAVHLRELVHEAHRPLERGRPPA